MDPVCCTTPSVTFLNDTVALGTQDTIITITYLYTKLYPRAFCLLQPPVVSDVVFNTTLESVEQA